jgi:DNA-directed RNA polymerase beta' subunit
MKLKMLDVDKYIQDNNLKPVTTTTIFTSNGISFDDNGRWSEEIFGRVGSKDRKAKFGYINLNLDIINPVVYGIISSTSPILRDMLYEKNNFELNDAGEFIESETGETGVAFFCKNINKINFKEMAKKDKVKDAVFLEKNRKLLIINKLLMIPAGVRDLSLTRSKAAQFTSEINDLYEKLISLSNQLTIGLDEELEKTLINIIQKVALQIHRWMQDNIKGKYGVLRGAMLKKTIDYSARIVATSDPNIPVGTIGVPWHTTLTLYQPFFFNYVFHKDAILRDEIAKEMMIDDGDLDSQKLYEFGNKITRDPDNIPENLKQMLIKCAEDITEGKDILCKRDPAVDRGSYYSASIKILPKGKYAVVNSLSCTAQNLDFDGDQLALMPVFTDEALKEAAKLNPAKSKSVWLNPVHSRSHQLVPTQDIIPTIYAATLS